MLPVYALVTQQNSVFSVLSVNFWTYIKKTKVLLTLDSKTERATRACRHSSLLRAGLANEIF